MVLDEAEARVRVPAKIAIDFLECPARWESARSPRQTGDLGSLVRRHRRRLRAVAPRRRCRLLPELLNAAPQHRTAQTEFLANGSDRSATRHQKLSRLSLVLLGKQSTLTYFHSTHPGSLSLLQVSTHSEEVRVAAHRQLLES